MREEEEDEKKSQDLERLNEKGAKVKAIVCVCALIYTRIDICCIIDEHQDYRF